MRQSSRIALFLLTSDPRRVTFMSDVDPSGHDRLSANGWKTRSEILTSRNNGSPGKRINR